MLNDGIYHQHVYGVLQRSADLLNSDNRQKDDKCKVSTLKNGPNGHLSVGPIILLLQFFITYATCDTMLAVLHYCKRRYV